jgi:hypothetical protein
VWLEAHHAIAYEYDPPTNTWRPPTSTCQPQVGGIRRMRKRGEEEEDGDRGDAHFYNQLIQL